MAPHPWQLVLSIAIGHRGAYNYTYGPSFIIEVHEKSCAMVTKLQGFC